MRQHLSAATGLALLSTAAAHAHSGGHSHLSLWQAIAHLAEPLHLGLVAAGVVAGAASLRRVRHRQPAEQRSTGERGHDPR